MTLSYKLLLDDNAILIKKETESLLFGYSGYFSNAFCVILILGNPCKYVQTSQLCGSTSVLWAGRTEGEASTVLGIWLIYVRVSLNELGASKAFNYLLFICQLYSSLSLT